MNKNVIIIIVILVVVIGAGVVYYATREEAVENTIEAGIEEALGGDADVDIDDNTVTINTDSGTFESGSATELPDGFPSDIYVADGEITSATHFTEEDADAYNISIVPTRSVDEVKNEYKTELVNDGWEIIGTLDTADLFTISAEKVDRTLAVSVSESDGESLVVISTSGITE